jgi:hypothetical protein
MRVVILMAVCGLMSDATSVVAAVSRQSAGHPAVTLKLRGLPPLVVRSIRYETPPGQSPFNSPYRCRVTLTAPGRGAVTVETIGIGNTETVSCDGLAAVGAVPGPMPRIGFVYDTSSPNASGRTPVVVALDRRSGRWAVDDALSLGLVDRMGTMTIRAMRRALATR